MLKYFKRKLYNIVVVGLQKQKEKNIAGIIMKSLKWSMHIADFPLSKNKIKSRSMHVAKICKSYHFYITVY